MVADSYKENKENKMKKYLFTFTAIGTIVLAGSVRAEDITSALYLPSEYEMSSNTSVAFQKLEFKDARADKDFIIRENLDLGIAEQTALQLSLANRLNSDHLSSQQYNNDFNMDYELGIAKNFPMTENWVMQLGASYYTFDPKSWYGHSYQSKALLRDELGSSRWYKELRGKIKMGYELEDGLMPYATFEVDGNVDNSNRHLEYITFAGIHKNEYTFSYDVGLRYQFASNNNNESWFMQGASDYFFNEDMAIGGYADYRFAGSYTPKMDYGYTIGARFKIKF